jgi:hypothetical protein
VRTMTTVSETMTAAVARYANRRELRRATR